MEAVQLSIFIFLSTIPSSAMFEMSSPELLVLFKVGANMNEE